TGAGAAMRAAAIDLPRPAFRGRQAEQQASQDAQCSRVRDHGAAAILIFNGLPIPARNPQPQCLFALTTGRRACPRVLGPPVAFASWYVVPAQSFPRSEAELHELVMECQLAVVARCQRESQG